ncbi:LacI family transcriptional regulator (plasmid) [Deinococcus sp. KNUC1210]|uniref:LacI family DNA-binding transcriptional regulator n=1 Tax=Deinococcus sp. KNUC1210 TaxID=2917691 RepID=UPI001EF011D0|nr:LacI family DNA-binding transcriptional regulator [Deinococcus sp. KNUC1210]ULH18029.1 LacI family transcriptional regulator [Deinococcus sp. KNUC1210]
MPSRPTMHDVARLAEVSTKTVSRVVNDEPRVDPLTRERVVQAIATLGFQRNEQARSLRPGQRSTLIGMVTGDLGNPFYSAIARGIDEVGRLHGYLLLSSSSEEQPARERQLIETLLRHNVDGLLIVPAAGDHRYLTPTMLTDVPLLVIDRPITEEHAFDTVVLENRQGAFEAVTALIQAGHRRIGVIEGDSEVYTGSERMQGYFSALKHAGITPEASLVRRGFHGGSQAERATHDLLNHPEPPTAIFATNNRIAVGVLSGMKGTGTWLPLACFDDFELADMLPVPVTVVTYDAAEMGRSAAELLFARLNGLAGEPVTKSLPVQVHTYPAVRS